MHKNIKAIHVGLAAAAILAAVSGCSRQQPVSMAPPVAPPAPVSQEQGSAGIFDWHDVPTGQRVPITRGVFDQGGYQLFAQSGETIVVPFANQNMYVMKFGRSDGGGMYFVNDNSTPTLYVPNGGYLENASAQNAKWYPFPQNYVYERPVYIGLAPTWADFVGMGWYPGMAYYGGYWGYRPWAPGLFYTPMVGLNIHIGGRPYYGWDSYHTYYRSNPVNRVSLRPTYNYASVGRQSGSSFGRNTGRGSFGSRPSGSTFGTARNRPSGSSAGGSFGRSNGGSFGSSESTASSTRRPGLFGGGSFGGSSSGFSSSNRSRGSFGGGSSGFSGFFRRGGGSSSSGSFGGGSFGRRSGGSFGGSFGRRR